MPKLEVVDGELIENGTLEETYTFSLLHKGMGLFEELSGKPLMAYLMGLKGITDDVNEDTIEKLMSKNFINNLACASYVKIEDNKFHNNRATAEEFKKTFAFQKITEDFDFITKLLAMATDCITEMENAEVKTKSNNSKKL